MARTLVIKASFQRAYDRRTPPEQALVKKTLQLLDAYLHTGHAPAGLGLKKLGPGVYECRVGLALRCLYVDEGSVLALVLLGSHDEVRRFLKRS